MNKQLRNIALPGICLAATLGGSGAWSTEPCGDFGECKTLVEINSSDGDIGFHFLSDGDDLIVARVLDPERKEIFRSNARRVLKEQTFTELFVESAEPLCFDPTADDDPENDEEDFTTLEEFISLWTPGTYRFVGRDADQDIVVGSTVLGFDLPAAPADLSYAAGMITWAPGDDLGECADSDRLQELVDDGMLPEHPEEVTVAAWEIVLEPDVDDGDPIGDEKYTIRIAGEAQVLAVSVPAEYLAALPDDTPAKLEIGAIGEEDNATFTEVDGICLNEVEGCENEEDEEEDEGEDDGEDEGEDE